MAEASPDTTPDVLVLCDDRPGHANQALGVAEATGWPFDTIRLHYRTWPGPVPVLPLSRLLHLDPHSRDAVKQARPDVVIGCGQRTASVAAWLKRKTGCLWLQLMKPPLGLRRSCDLIAAPAHDRLPPDPRHITTTGAPNRITAARLASERETWAARYGALPGPRLALILGGDTRHAKWTTDDAARIADYGNAWVAHTGGAIIGTTSRRTPEFVHPYLTQHCTAPGLDLFQASIPGHDNPYFGLLAWADHILVTADSASQMSEAASSGVEASLYTPQQGIAPKLMALRDRLIVEGYADHCALPFQPEPGRGITGLDDARDVAKSLVKAWDKKSAGLTNQPGEQ